MFVLVTCKTNCFPSKSMGLANAKDHHKVLLLFANNQSVCLQLFTTKAQSLLLMTSVAMPVFSKKKETVRVTQT